MDNFIGEQWTSHIGVLWTTNLGLDNLLTARPKRLRFLVFTVPGRLITHARQLWLRLAQWLAAIQLLPAPT